MGIEDANNPCVDVAHGKAALESIVMHLLEPDEDSIAVAHHLLRAPARGESGKGPCTLKPQASILNLQPSSLFPHPLTLSPEP